MEAETLKTLIDGGQISVTLATLWVLYKTNQSNSTTVNNHIAHDMQEKERLTNAITRLTQFLEDKMK